MLISESDKTAICRCVGAQHRQVQKVRAGTRPQGRGSGGSLGGGAEVGDEGKAHRHRVWKGPTGERRPLYPHQQEGGSPRGHSRRTSGTGLVAAHEAFAAI